MANISKIITLLIGIFTFLIISLLGIAAQVSWSVIFLRSIIAAFVVGLLTYASFFIILNYVIKEFIQENDSFSNFEYTADEDISISDLSNLEIEQLVSNDSQTKTLNTFRPTQIDSDIENIINQDPQKAADILRKMGLDD